MAVPRIYDDLLSVSPQASIYTNLWWLEAVAPGRYKLLEVRNPEGDLLAAWPLVYREADSGLIYEMPVLTQKLGIIFAPSTLKAIEEQSAKQKLTDELIKLIDYAHQFHQQFHETFTDWLPFYWQGFAQTTRYTYILQDLTDIDRVWSELRPNHRRDIRRSERLGIRVRDDLALSEFLELNRQTYARQGLLPVADDDTIHRVDAACLKHARRKIFAGVDVSGNVHAAVYVAWWRDTAYYLMGGSDTRFRDSGAQLLTLWEAIKFTSKVIMRFDFEGSMLPRVERIFRGFGAKQIPYFTISKFPPPPSSLREHVKASIAFRVNRMRQKLGFSARAHANSK
jgi:hypothetical protein